MARRMTVCWAAGCLCAVALLAGPAEATLVIAHSGYADPTDEGWTVWGGAYHGADVADGAWDVGTSGVRYHYLHWYWVPGEEKGDQRAWRVTSVMKAHISPSLGPTGLYNVYFAVANGLAATYVCDINATNDGWLTISDHKNLYTLTGLSPYEYHTYGLAHQANATTADLSVDGTYVASLHAEGVLGPGVEWGAGDSDSRGMGGYQSVQFEVDPWGEASAVPEPASCALLVLAAGGLGAMVRRRRRT